MTENLLTGMLNLDTNTQLIVTVRLVRWNMGPHPLGPKEIDGLLVPQCKASMLLTDTWLTLDTAQEKWFKSNMPYWLSWVVIFEALFGCHDILILGNVESHKMAF